MLSRMTSFILWAITFLTSNLSLSQTFTQPQLPLPSRMDLNLYVEESLRDPVLNEQTPQDVSSFEQSKIHLRDISQSMSTTKGSRREELAKEMLQEVITSYYFLSNVNLGRVEGMALASPAEMLSLRQKIVAWSNQLIQSTKSKSVIAWAKYHRDVFTYLNGEKNKSISLLKQDVESFSSSLKNRARWLIAYHQKNEGNALEVAAQSLPKITKLQTQIFIAAQKKSGFEKHLSSANQLLNSIKLNDKERLNLQLTILTLWKNASGKNIVWKKAPVSIKSIQDENIQSALIERMAIDDWKSGDLIASDKKWQALVQQNQATQFKLAIQNQYYKFIDLNSDEALRAKSLSQGRIQTLANVHENFHETVDHPQAKISFNLKLAKIYEKNNLLKSSRDIYFDLALNLDAKNKLVYLQNIARIQTQITRWSMTPPWNNSPIITVKQDGNILLDTYEKIQEAKGKQTDWNSLAHIGLIKIQLGDLGGAIELWENALADSPRGENAQSAAGYLLELYSRSSQWDQLEKLSRLCLKTNLKPVHAKKSLNPRQYLARSLFQGGKKNFEEANYERSIQRLEEYTREYRSEKTHGEGLMVLAKAYHQHKQHVEAIKTLIAYIQVYPKGSFFRESLILGSKWSEPMAYEENNLYFMEKFNDKFSKDIESSKVRLKLAALYLGRGRYGQGISILKTHAQSKNISLAEKMATWEKVLYLEKRYSSLERASITAQKLVNDRSSSHDLKIMAYEVLSDKAYANKKYAELQIFERKVLALGIASERDQELIAKLRYEQAKLQNSTYDRSIYNLSLRNPGLVLNSEMKKYESAKGKFTRVCEYQNTSYCSLAMHELARSSEDMKDILDQITIPTSLDKETVDGFTASKKQYIQSLDSDRLQFDKAAVAGVTQGSANPDTTSTILWQNMSDWNFSEITTRPGNSYIEWGSSAIGMIKDLPSDWKVLMQPKGEIHTAVSTDIDWYAIRSDKKSSQDALLMSLIATKHFEEAEKLARTILSAKPGSKPALMGLSLSLAMQLNWDLAVYYTDIAEKSFGENSMTQNIRGLKEMFQILSDRNDYSQAISYLEKAKDLSSEEIGALMNLSFLHLETGNAAAAQGTFKQMTERNRKCLEGFLGQGIAARRLGNKKLAEKSFEEVLELEEFHGEAMYHLALTKYNKDLDDNSEAEKILVKVLNDTKVRKNKIVSLKARSVLQIIRGKTSKDESDENFVKIAN